MPTVSGQLICFLNALPCPALPSSSDVYCLSLSATSFSVYACVDLCHGRKQTVQHEKRMRVDHHGALDVVTSLQMMVIKVGHVWIEGPSGAEERLMGAVAKWKYCMGTQQSTEESCMYGRE